MKSDLTLHLKNDIVFKAVYGRDTPESKHLLIHLLNLILNRKEDPIVDLEYKNPFHISVCAKEKESILDIKVITNSNELIDIEMQLLNRDSLINRTIYYHGGSLRESLKKGEPYGKMLKTITICIVDDILFPETEDFLSIFEMRESKGHFLLSDNNSIHYIELPKVNRTHKTVQELSQLELHLEYLKCAGDRKTEYVGELLAQGGKELQMTQYVLEKTTEEELLREKALAHEKWVRDMDDYTATMREYKIKLKEYETKTHEYKNQVHEYEDQVQYCNKRIENLEKDKVEMAKEMINDGISIEKVMLYTGLSNEYIEKL